MATPSGNTVNVLLFPFLRWYYPVQVQRVFPVLRELSGSDASPRVIKVYCYQRKRVKLQKCVSVEAIKYEWIKDHGLKGMDHG
jgi:hypothetical protein